MLVYRGARASGVHYDPAIISEANSLYRAVRQPNRILDNAIIRTACKLDACVQLRRVYRLRSAAYGT